MQPSATSATQAAGNSEEADGGSHIPALGAVGKAVAILDVLAYARVALSVGETARRAGLAKATAYRILTVLEEHGLALRNQSGYVLGGRLQQWAMRPSGELELRQSAMPRLLAIHQAIGLPTRLSIRDDFAGLNVRPVETLFSEPHRSLVERSSTPAAANATASGKIFLAFDHALAEQYLAYDKLPGYTDRTITTQDRLLAELHAVRNSGVATARGEYLPELSSLAVPIYGPGRRVVASIAVGGYGNEPISPGIERLARQEAAEISVVVSRHRRR
jgi:DNA-binding IclR family transcriptional regulator